MRLIRGLHNELTTSFGELMHHRFFHVAIALFGMIAVTLPLVHPAFGQHANAPQAETRIYKAGSIVVEAPWSRATPGGAKVAGGYMKITNTGSEPDRLVGGSIPVAGKMEAHEMSTENGVMKMRQLPGGLEIKPGATVELKPGGYHLMFMDLRQGLKDGQTIKGMLNFEKAGPLEVEYRVGGIGGHGAEH
jgi:periplasmic copper chaperone A